MKFHKVEMVGKFNLQKVETLPTFDSATDEGRLVYNLNDGLVYHGTDTRWKVVDNEQIAVKNINSEPPYEARIAYYDGDVYYADGVEWKKIGEETEQTNLTSYTNQFSSDTMWIVNHNLNSYANIVQCWNDSHQAITPNSIIQTSKDSLTVIFGAEQSGYAIIFNVGDFTYIAPGTGGGGVPGDPGAITASGGIFFRNSNYWTVNHGFGTNYLLVNIWDNSSTYPEKILPYDNIINDFNNISVNFDGVVVNGYATVLGLYAGTGVYRKTHSLDTQWIFDHQLNSNEILVQCWNGSGKLIHPNYIEKIDNNNILIDFNGINTNGYISIISTNANIGTGDMYFESVASNSIWNINHSLNSQNLIVQVWSNNRIVKDYRCLIDDNNNITVDFDGDNVAGDVIIIKVS